MPEDLEGSVEEPQERIVVDFKVPAGEMIRAEAKAQGMSTKEYIKYCFNLARVVRKVHETGDIYFRDSSGNMNRFQPYEKA